MNDLLSSALYQKILIEPMKARRSLDELLVVSGYAAAGMGLRHITDMRGIRGTKIPTVKLVCGMARESKIGNVVHNGFLDLCRRNECGFSCRYLVKGEPVHAKVYIWCETGRPVVAFAGSANYSQNAFRETNTRREVLTRCSERMAFDFYNSLLPDTVDCTDGRRVRGVVGKANAIPSPATSDIGIVSEVKDPDSPWNGLLTVKTSLLQTRGKNKGKIHNRGGLNWGQRKGREPNQAYIPVNGVKHFFPEKGDYFTIRTDDGATLQCVRAQDRAKAIETYGDNSLLGKYFRKRLGVKPGAFVELKDLINYGRKDVTFYKIDDENFFMDFSVKS